MKFFQCALTKEKTQNPVIHKKTGLIYDEIYLSNFLEKEKKCPFTGIEFKKEDIIKINNNISFFKNFNPDDNIMKEIRIDNISLKNQKNYLEQEQKDLIENISYQIVRNKLIEENIHKLENEKRILFEKYN